MRGQHNDGWIYYLNSEFFLLLFADLGYFNVVDTVCVQAIESHDVHYYHCWFRCRCRTYSLCHRRWSLHTHTYTARPVLHWDFSSIRILTDAARNNNDMLIGVSHSEFRSHLFHTLSSWARIPFDRSENSATPLVPIVWILHNSRDQMTSYSRRQA